MSLLKTLNDLDENIPFINDNLIEELCFCKYADRMFYWNNCSEIYNKKGELTFKDWNSIKYLDFKITSNMFEYDESYACLKNFVSNSQSKKLLHIVNTHHDYKSIFDMKEWDIIVKELNKFNLKDVIIEIVNKFVKNKEIYANGLTKCGQISNAGRIEYFLFTNPRHFIFNDKDYIDYGKRNFSQV